MDTEPFSQRLRRVRQAAGLTQEALAARARVSVRSVSDLERGVVGLPRMDTAVLLADGLGLTGLERQRFLLRDEAAHPVVSIGIRLPRPRTPIIDRERETGEILAILADPSGRLVTLTGPGGVGKTRLATHAAATAAQDAGLFPAGVALVELAGVREAGLVLDTIATALGARRPGDGDLVAAVAAALPAESTLLVLDNLEQVVAAGPEIARLLDAAPGLRLLVTSRVPLRIAGERRLPIGPLPFAAGSVADGAALPPAERLYLERAEAVSPGQDRSPDQIAAISRLCRRLEGLPLAIELAAARANLLDPAEQLALLDRSLPLLGEGPADAPDRHRTMRATIAWDYDLLTPGQQAAFEQLACFRGGFTLTAAGSVLGADLATAAAVTGELIDRSLVVRERADDGTSRYRVLEPLAEYARERAAAEGRAPAALDRHAAWAAAYAEELGSRHLSGEDFAISDLLEAETDNLRAALGHTIASGDAVGAARLVGGLWFHWFTRGSLAEGTDWAERALALPPPQHHGGLIAWSRAQAAAAWLHGLRGNHAAAVRHGEAAAATSADLEDDRARAFANTMLGFALGMSGRHAEAREATEAGLACAERSGDPLLIPFCANRLGIELVGLGEVAAAVPLFERALAAWRGMGFLWGIGTAEENLGQSYKSLGNWHEAVRHYREQLALPADPRDVWGIINVLIGLAEMRVAAGDHPQAAILLGAAEQLRRDGDIVLQSHDAANRARAEAAVAAALPAAVAAGLHAKGAALPFRDVLALAIAVEPPA